MRRPVATAITVAVLIGVGASIAVVGLSRLDRGGNAATAPVQQQRQATTQAAAPARGVPVETTNARAANTTADIRAVGSLQSDESVQIASEIAGRVAEIAFKEGETVKEGDVLVKLDDALARAEVVDVQARYELAKSNIDRANQLARTGSVTGRARDEATAAFEIGRAAVELSQVRLDKHTIKAPFAGVVGFRNVSAGAFVNVGAAIVNLEKIDTLKVDFKIPEVHLADVIVGQNIEVIVDALPGRTFTGTIYAIDPMVDVNGRALQIRARLPNANRLLRPGLFVRIVIKGQTETAVVMVPESAVVPRGTEAFVYRVEDGKAVETKVRLGGRKAGQVEVIEGLSPNSVVVTAGHQRLRNGAAVDVITSDVTARG